MPNISFAQRLKDLRAEKTAKDGRMITRNEVADYLGVTAGSVGMWEAGHRANPSAENMLRLCEFYQIPVEDLASTLAPDVKILPAAGGGLQTQRIPVTGLFTDGQPIQTESTVAMVDVPGRHGDAYCVLVRGDVPHAMMVDGDLVVVRRRPSPELGETVLADLDGKVKIALYDKIAPGEKRKKVPAVAPLDGSKLVPITDKNRDCLVGAVTALYRKYLES